MRSASIVATILIVLALSACGGSSKKSSSITSGSATSASTSSQSSTTAKSASGPSPSGGVTSAPGSPDPYGPTSPTSPTGLGRLLVKNGYAKGPHVKCIADGLLKELSAPEIQAVAEKRATKGVKAHITAVAHSCAGGAPSGG